MKSSTNKKIETEAEYLKHASIYVGCSEIEKAILLLERARLTLPVTNRLINALGKLYLSVGKPVEAAECFQNVLNKSPKSDGELYEELPIAEDIRYLAEQSRQLREKEYSFETPEAQVSIKTERETLSLGIKKSA